MNSSSMQAKGEIEVEVTNLGRRTMQLKNMTLFAGKRVWPLYTPRDMQPTLPLETKVPYVHRVDWDYGKYPLIALDGSLPEDFLIEIETTRAVHRKHFVVASWTLNSLVWAL
jgi:hypothetical protein